MEQGITTNSCRRKNDAFKAISGLSLSLTLFFLFAFPGALRSEQKDAPRRDIIKKEKRLEDVRKQIREEKQGVKAASEKETSVLGELEEINKNLTAKREELHGVEAELKAIESKVAAANAGIERLEKERKALSERLKQRLRAIYRMRRGQAVTALFSSASSRDIGRRHKYLTMVMDADTGIISGYEKNLLRYEGEKKRLDGFYKDLSSARRDVLLKKAEVEAAKREKVALLTDVKREKERRIKTIRELTQAAAELSDLLKSLKTEEEPSGDGSGFASMKGRLTMPVEGKVVSFYGKVKHPKFQTVTFNNGIVIEAPAGTPVKSVYDGKVAYSGWLKGYGQVMIIDHGGGFYTIMGNLSKIIKERGSAVKKGDDAGLVGDSGPQAAPGLYFEIRQKGIPRDPMSWFAER